MAAVEVARLYHEAIIDRGELLDDDPLVKNLQRASRMIDVWLDQFDPPEEGG